MKGPVFFQKNGPISTFFAFQYKDCKPFAFGSHPIFNGTFLLHCDLLDKA